MNSKITICVSEEEKKALMDYAKREDITISQILRKAIREILREAVVED